jgi:hypothetical protein
MTFKMKNMAYWKAKNGLPGVNNDFEKNGNLPDGRSTSSPFQDSKDKKKNVNKKKVKKSKLKTEEDYLKEGFSQKEAKEMVKHQAVTGYDMPDPTWPGTDEYRSEKEIGKKEIDKIVKSGKKD